MFIELVWRFIKRELKVRYAGSLLGQVWLVLYPLMFTLVSATIFSLIFKNMTGEIPYFLYVLIGTMVWVYFSQGLMMATRSLVSNREIVSNAKFDWSSIVVGGVMVKCFDFMINLVLFCLIFLLGGQEVSPMWLGLPLLIIIQSVVLVGLGLISATLNVYFRDTQSLVEICLQVLYFLTPVVYPISIVPERYRWLVYLNPVTGLINLYRNIIFGFSINFVEVGLLALVGAVTLLVGVMVFGKYKYKFSELI